MLKVLITGESGYIAKSIHFECKDKYDISTVGRKDFDLTNTNEVKNYFKNKYFDVIINTSVVGGSRLEKDHEHNTYKNILMFDNLLENKDHFKKLINFGSGAEIYYPTTPYGLSKKVINKIIQNTEDFYNLRIFAVFDHNEIETRFIKQCIKNCLNNKPINIDQNRFFDFFYMKDLIKIVDHYIISENLDKTIECCYSEKRTLSEIACYICNFFHKDTETNILLKNKDFGMNYIGGRNSLNINYIGLENGILDTISLIR